MPDLFSGTPWEPGRRRARSRRTDPGTSWDAAASLSDAALAEIEKVVLLAIASRPNGATWKEQEDMLPHLGRQTISPRWTRLREVGLIEPRYESVPVILGGTPTVRKVRITRPGWTNRGQTVWFATPAGEAIARIVRDLTGPYGEVLDAVARR